MSDLERLIRCAMNDRVEVAIRSPQNSTAFVETVEECMERLRTVGEGEIHFVLSKHRKESAYVLMNLDCPILDHTHGGYIDAVLYP